MSLKVFLVQEMSMLYLINKPNVFLCFKVKLFCWFFFHFDCPRSFLKARHLWGCIQILYYFIVFRTRTKGLWQDYTIQLYVIIEA